MTLQGWVAADAGSMIIATAWAIWSEGCRSTAVMGGVASWA
jgi:hypothetical protein